MNFPSGTIFKFDIPFKLGVAYCRLDNFLDINPLCGIFISVFDFFEDIDIKDLSIFHDMPLFMNSIPIIKMPTIRGKFAWQKLGHIKSLNFYLPAFKTPEANGFAWDSLEQYERLKWYAWVGLREKAGPVHFNKVRHLEEIFVRSTTTVEKRVAMATLRYRKMNVVDYFSSQMEKDYWRTDFKTQQFIPLYKKLPEAIRGRPLMKGYVPDGYLNFDWDTVRD